MTTAVVATTYGGPEVLSATEIDVPDPGRGEVTVEVRAAGINPIDYKSFSGMMGADESALPMRVGIEVSGVVTAVGDDASGPAGEISVGDEVICFPVSGGYAAALTVPAASVVPKPSGMSFEQAAGLLLTGVTAYHLVEATGVTLGDTVLVHGVAGGVGRMVAQLAIDRGATVIGTAAVGRHERLREDGIVPVEYGEGLADRVRAAAPEGVDVALDTIGTDEAVDVSLELVEDKDRIATVAAFGRAGDAGIQLLGNGPGADPGPEIRDRGRLVLTALVDRGLLHVTVARTFPLAEAADAVAFVAEGHAGGKVVLVP
jgi:NADPH:quinone reductase-like Zn-dependent oxidoreductase